MELLNLSVQKEQEKGISGYRINFTYTSYIHYILSLFYEQYFTVQ